MRPTPTHSVLLFLILPTFTRCLTAPPPYETTYILPSDAVSLLSFKSKADSDNKLLYTLTERFDYCQWQGVKCAQGRVVRFLVQGFGLRGTFPPDTLSRLDQLRVLSLSNNSLSGPVPDLSALLNLESLSLDHNSFSGTFPPSVLSLHRLTVLDLSYNNLSGPVPVQLSSLNRLYLLRLQWNRFNGTVPALNQRFLICFNVSGNNLTGQIPITPTLSRFGTTSFSLNPDLCGEIINKVCKSHSPFFASSSSGNATSPMEPLGQSAKAKGGGTVIVSYPPSMPPKHKRIGIIIESIIGVSFLILALVLTFFTLVKKQRKQNTESPEKQLAAVSSADRHAVSRSIPMEAPGGVMHAKTTETAAKEVQAKRAEKSGKLVFCRGGNVGEAPWPYTLDQLMRASAELLGRGTIGTTYKAVLDNQLIVTVKRLDANKTWITSSDAFERHMDVVGDVRHPNLVPMLAYFQTKGERLVIYEYQANGSLFSLIHGSRSTRARPLHWTSCLKIAEDVVQGLAYLHQTSKLVHGNLKSSNVLLGADFEACITDYCLAILADTSSEEPDSAAYKAPETRNFNRQATVKSDVYAFGVLLLELLTGKHPSQHPYLAPADMFDWVRVVREDGGGNENQLGMLTELASVCSLTSPEQRPAIWQVLKMVQEIKESAMVEENSPAGYL